MTAIASDQVKDTQDLVVAIIREAHRQADMVAAFLESIGFLPPVKKRKGETYELPMDLLLKLGALLKLYQWDQSGLTPCLRHNLPSWQEVYEDVKAQTQQRPTRFVGSHLSTQVLKTFVEQICWTPLENQAAEVAVAQSPQGDIFLDELAQLPQRLT